MSCKYCDIKMRPLDDDLEVLKGESWKDEFGEGGYIGQSYNDKFQMLVYYDAGCACTGVPDVKYCPFCGEKLKMPKEPLIEDRKIREIIRPWAKVNGATELEYDVDENSLTDLYRNTISFNRVLDLKDEYTYTITELCGEEEDDGKTVS